MFEVLKTLSKRQWNLVIVVLTLILFVGVVLIENKYSFTGRSLMVFSMLSFSVIGVLSLLDRE